MLQLVLNSWVFGHRFLGHFIGQQSQNISVRSLQLNVVYCCELDLRAKLTIREFSVFIAWTNVSPQVIAYEVWHSAHCLTTQPLNASPFDVMWVEKFTPPRCILSFKSFSFFSWVDEKNRLNRICRYEEVKPLFSNHYESHIFIDNFIVLSDFNFFH